MLKEGYNTCIVKIAQRRQGSTHWFLTTEGLANTKTLKYAVCTNMHSIPMLTTRLFRGGGHLSVEHGRGTHV